jgi:hypothetical protein
MSDTIKKLGVIAAASLAFGSAACSRLPDNEVAIKLRNGTINRVVTDPGVLCWLPCLPGTQFVRYATFNDTFTISSGQGASAGGNQGGQTTQARQIFLRSKDDKFIESVSISIVYEVTENDSVRRLYTDFRANAGRANENQELIRDDLQILVTQPLVNTIRSYDALNIQDQGGEIGQSVARGLQAAINERLAIQDTAQSPIRVVGVTVGGVKFDAETEQLLRQKIYATEQAAIAGIARDSARAQAEGAAAQAGVTGEIVGTLRRSGTPESQLASITCLDLKRQKLIPENTQCFGMGPR